MQSHKTDWLTIKNPRKSLVVYQGNLGFQLLNTNVERFYVSGKSMQTKVGRCLVTIIANGGETSLDQDNLRLIPSFLILIFFVQI